jgi:hypothetical protein
MDRPLRGITRGLAAGGVAADCSVAATADTSKAAVAAAAALRSTGVVNLALLTTVKPNSFTC